MGSVSFFGKTHMSVSAMVVLIASMVYAGQVAAVQADGIADQKCRSNGVKLGKWWVIRSSGNGCVTEGYTNGKYWVEEKPRSSKSQDETNAVLITGPSFTAPYSFESVGNTVAQLRQGSIPNPSEAGWWIFDYKNRPANAGGAGSFYYFILKTDGWELGKRDASYPGKQKTLISGTAPKLVINTWNEVLIKQYRSTAKETRIEIYVQIPGEVNPEFVGDYSDKEHPYMDGDIGLYSADADAKWLGIRAVPIQAVR